MENFDSTLLKPFLNEGSSGITNVFLYFINVMEGWKTRCKNLHWAAPKKNVHVYLDDFLEILSDYQDTVAEGYMGILGKMHPHSVNGIACNALNAMEIIEEIRTKTLSFYNSIPSESIYVGLKSETETFIHNINKYKYLFSLTDY